MTYLYRFVKQDEPDVTYFSYNDVQYHRELAQRLTEQRHLLEPGSLKWHQLRVKNGSEGTNPATLSVTDIGH